MGCQSSSQAPDTPSELFSSIIETQLQPRHSLINKQSYLLLLDANLMPGVMELMSRADLDALSFCCKSMAKMLIQAVTTHTFRGTKEQTLIVVGGCSGDNACRNDMERYSVSLDRWQSMPSRLNQARCAATMTIHDGELFVVGGAAKIDGATNHPERIFMELEASSECLDTVEKFSVRESEETSSWEHVLGLGTSMMHAGACSFALPGEKSQWPGPADSPTGENELCSELSELDAAQGVMYIVGGCQKTKKNTAANGCLFRVTKTGTSYSMTNSTQSKTHFTTMQFPIVGGCFSTPRSGAAVVQHAGLMYVIGGSVKGRYSKGTPLSSMIAFDRLTNNWEPLPAMRVPRWGASAVVSNGKIYVIGGVVVNLPAQGSLNSGPRRCCCTASVEVYDIETESWSKLAPLRQARTGATAVVFQGSLHVLGGFRLYPLKSVERYNAQAGCWEKCPPLQHARAGAVAAVVEIYNCTWTGAGSVRSNKKSKKNRSPSKAKGKMKVKATGEPHEQPV